MRRRPARTTIDKEARQHGQEGSPVFVRGLTSETYGLGHFRRDQLAVDRIRDENVVADDAKVGHSGDSEQRRTWWRIGPADEEFLTQILQGHFVELPAECNNHGHGQQNADYTAESGRIGELAGQA